MDEPLIETWTIHNRILLAAIPDDALGAAIPKHRSVFQMFAHAIEELLRRSVAAGGKVKGFKPHATAFAGYLISHESHHRGQIVWTLKDVGHSVDPQVSYGLWEWGVR